MHLSQPTYLGAQRAQCRVQCDSSDANTRVEPERCPELAEVNTPDVIAAATPWRASANPTVSPWCSTWVARGKALTILFAILSMKFGDLTGLLKCT